MDSLIADQVPLARGLEVDLLCPPGSAAIPLLSVGCREVGRAGGHVWEQVELPSFIRDRGLLSLCNTGALLARKHIVCMHDANVWNAPQSYSFPFRTLYRSLLPGLGRTARQVATVSEYSLGELVGRGIVRAERAFVAPNGHEHAVGWKPEHSVATRRAASRNTIVLIGSPAPHKNVAFILDMAGRLAEAGLRIAVAGAADPRVFSARSHADAANIHWLGRVSDGELAALLGDSLCLAFPSLTEGFGLPALEAMALGCPVVVSDRASLPEVCGDSALFAPPDDPDAWFDSFVRLRGSSTLWHCMVGKGHARASAYRWRDTAFRYLTAMAVADGFDPDGAVVRMHQHV